MSERSLFSVELGSYTATPGEAADFALAGMDQLDYLLLGEEDAKMAMLATMASGANNVLVGIPGGGKTTLGENAYRLISDIRPEEIAIVPPQSDLDPEQLLGGENVLHKTNTTTFEGETTTHEEDTVMKIDALIRPETRIIFANEINRVGPYAVNAMLEVYESGKVDSTAGRSYVDLLYSTSTMNPSERRQVTFDQADATASRHAIGAVLGDGSEDEREHRMYRELDGWVPQPELMEPFITINGLKAIKACIDDPKSVAFPNDLKKHTVDLIKKAQGVLRKPHEIVEADGRFTKQVARNARTLAVLGGQARISEENVRDAVKYVATARLGMLGPVSGSVEDAVAEIVGK